MKVTGAEWPLARAPVSPCPTLKVISFVTSVVEKKEELLRNAKSGPSTAPRTMGELMGGKKVTVPPRGTLAF